MEQSSIMAKLVATVVRTEYSFHTEFTPNVNSTFRQTILRLVTDVGLRFKKRIAFLQVHPETPNLLAITTNQTLQTSIYYYILITPL